MIRYFGIDCGKSNCKVAMLNPEFLKDEKKQPYFVSQFRTAMSEGTFEDDEPGKNTYICEYEGEVYKIGKSASKEAELVSSKKSLVHKICTLLAIAKDVDTGDEVVVSVGIPSKDYATVAERNAYRDYICPLGEHTVKYRDLDGEIKEKTFTVTKVKVYPEGIGGIFAEGIDLSEPVCVIDIGHLNVNLSLFTAGEIDSTLSVSTQRGANFMVSGLAQELSSYFGTNVSKAKAAEIIVKDRKLRFRNPDPEKEEESVTVIKKYIDNYVASLLEEARSKDLPIDVLQLVIIGGTTGMIGKDLKEVFGENTFIPENGCTVNAIGFLKLLCGRSDTLKIKLP